MIQGRVTLVERTWDMFDRYRRQHPEKAARAKAVLRHAERVGGDYQWKSWQGSLGLTPAEIEAELLELQKMDICDFTGWKFGWVFELLHTSAPDRPQLRELLERQRDSVELRSIKAKQLAHGSPDCRRLKMLRYLGEGQPGFDVCGGCDACTPTLRRPWERIEIHPEQIQEAVQETADLTILILVDTVARGQWSRRNIVRTLRGDGGGPYPLDQRLALHSCFAQLAMLTTDQVENRIEELVEQDILEAPTPPGRSYQTLRLTDLGEELVRGRFAR